MRFALKNLSRRRLRTALSILGVGVGVGGIVAFSALGQGLKRSLEEYATQSGADLIAIDGRVANPEHGRISRRDFERILAHPGVADTGGSLAMPVPFGKGRVPMAVIGRDPEEKPIQAYANPWLRGRLLASTSEAMVGMQLAEEQGIGLGGRIELLDRRFEVVGIFRTGVKFENVGVVVHADVLRERLGMDKGTAMGAFIFLKDPDAWMEAAAGLSLLLPHLRILPTRLLTSSLEQFAYVDTFVWVISLAALLVGAIGILNTMLMSVSERVREIGTLRAFGWSRGMVLRLILMEGLWTSVLGGLVGFGIGVVGSELLLSLVPQEALEAAYEPAIFGRGMAAALVLGFAGGLYPAWRASRLAPAEALRYE